MPRLRVLLFTVACVFGAVLGTAGASYADSAPDCGAHPTAHALSAGGTGQRAVTGSACAQRLGATATAATPIEPGAPLVATAIRHVPRPGEPASPDGLDPAADKAMVLLIGWSMLALLGGSVIAGSGLRPRE
ncbi:MAG TPA: hypothetical protein VGM60_24420 [Pseudonocardia sp.]|uniref:hypothetical protein n=1 Tax=Pseudonocardia sp. TaxID=60912 RepID=UPI002F3FA1C4